MTNLEQQEAFRLAEQSRLDAIKDRSDKKERNRLGQFATPSELANDILKISMKLMQPNTPIRFLDPALGTGAFVSALFGNVANRTVERCIGVEIDPHYYNPAKEIWQESPLQALNKDFTALSHDAIGKFNLIVCNPPYVRHQHLSAETKKRLKESTASTINSKVSARMGLYCHFIASADKFLEEHGVSVWLIPSEFMDVNYGGAIKHYLLHQVETIRVHRFPERESKFGGALVSSAVVFFKKSPKVGQSTIEFTAGDSLLFPSTSKKIDKSILQEESKWTRFPSKGERAEYTGPRIKDFFKVKRGLATGGNDFFIVTRDQAEQHNLPKEFLTPILPSPKHIHATTIEADENGTPRLESPLFLVDCRLEPDKIKNEYPSLWSYLEHGKALGINESYLCRNRKQWYWQEHRVPSPFYCTYIGRKSKKSDRPFSFILNRSKAVVSNSLLALEPLKEMKHFLDEHPEHLEGVWKILNNLCNESMKDEGRVYGGGMHKMEPKELSNVPAKEMGDLLSNKFIKLLL